MIKRVTGAAPNRKDPLQPIVLQTELIQKFKSGSKGGCSYPAVLEVEALSAKELETNDSLLRNGGEAVCQFQAVGEDASRHFPYCVVA